MNVTITGIGGFLGGHLAGRLSGKFEISGVSTGKSKQIFPVFSFEDLHQVPSPDVVIHCHAAVASGQNQLDAAQLYQGNILATQKILAQFPAAKHLYCSTVAVYGTDQAEKSERSPINPQSAYARSKAEAEQLFGGATQSAIVRFSSLYGPRMKENTLIPNYVNQALQTRIIEVWGSGERRQNYFHVQDAVALIESILHHDKWKDAVFLGVSTREYANNEIASLIASETGAAVRHINQDASVSVQYNNAFTRNTLNWHPERETAEAIKDYIQWKKKPF